MDKNCSKCQRELPLDRFRVHKRDGIVAACKDCEREGWKNWLKTTPKGKTHRREGRKRWKQTTNGQASQKLSQKKWRDAGGKFKNAAYKAAHPDKVQAYFTKYNHSEKGKAARERFEYKKRLAKAFTLIAMEALREQGE